MVVFVQAYFHLCNRDNRSSLSFPKHPFHTWNSTLPYFILAKDCGPLPVPMNGTATGRETTYPNQVTFDCDDGFIMIGSRIRKCQSNGKWSGNETSCLGKKCTISGPFFCNFHVTFFKQCLCLNKCYDTRIPHMVRRVIYREKEHLEWVGLQLQKLLDKPFTYVPFDWYLV